MRFSKDYHHEQIIEHYLAISARIRPDLRLPVRRDFHRVAAAYHHSRQHYRHADPLVLLALQILPAKWVNPGCFVLIRYMALLFVPIGVGVMQYFDLLKAQFGPIVVSCAVSTLVVFLVVSWSSHLVHGERNVIGEKTKK
jgi:hypothetical protein